MPATQPLPPLFLVGARACGKSSTGKLAAVRLKLAFVDTDAFICTSSRKTIDEIVTLEGWQAFRAQESAALAACTAPNTIIATGGGMVLEQKNRLFMRAAGLVVYLAVPASVLGNRLCAAAEAGLRPSLTGLPPHEEIAQILSEREALYRGVAHHIVDGTLSPALVAEKLAQLLVKGQTTNTKTDSRG